MRLRRDGYSFAEIAEMLNVTSKDAENKVRYLVEAGLARITRPAAESLRDEMEDRLDQLFNRSMRIAKADGPDRVAAINAAVNVANRISALRGLDAPKQVDLKDERQSPPDDAAKQKFLEGLAEEYRILQSRKGEGST
jgi:DNA-binding transcriptional regulator LsrR (DeoR family)